MKNKILKISALALVGSSLIGCGSGDGSDSTTADTIINSNLRDANIVGMGYKTAAGVESITGKNGSLNCNSGENVEFFIGTGDTKLPMGESKCVELITPEELTSTENAKINMVRFLNTLDSGLADGEITISTTTAAIFTNRTGAASTKTITFNTTTAAFAIPTEISDLSGLENITTANLISASSATTHIADTLKCAYSGAFKGTMIENDSVGPVAMYITPDDGISHYIQYDSHNSTDRNAEIIGSGVASTKAFTLYDGARTTLTGTVSINKISGTFVEQAGDNLENGTFSVIRMGGDANSIYRFSGQISTMKALTFDIDSDNKVKAYVYNVRGSGTQHNLNGSLTGDSLIANTAGYTLTATVDTTNFTVSNPVWTYPYDSPGQYGTATFTATGCKLNPVPAN
jgi:hypothetical protein